MRSGEFKNEKCDEVIIDGYWRGNFSLKKIFWKSDEYFSPMNDVIGFYYYKTFTKFTGSECLYELLLLYCLYQIILNYIWMDCLSKPNPARRLNV